MFREVFLLVIFVLFCHCTKIISLTWQWMSSELFWYTKVAWLSYSQSFTVWGQIPTKIKHNRRHELSRDVTEPLSMPAAFRR